MLFFFTVSIDRLSEDEQTQLSSPHNEDDGEEARILKQCDFFHLLTDVCAPALRVVMLNGLDAQAEKIKEVLSANFNSY